MYYDFFGLARPPFRITPDTEMFYDGGNRGVILEALIYAISQGEGIIKVTGEVGSGKTMLCRMLQTRLPESVETVYLANPSVSPEEILHAIAFELQLPVTKDADRIEVMHTLNKYLLDQHAKGHQVVLFVEESQSMPVPTLEEVRLLSNLETNHHKLLQIVLFGQPELDDNLRRPEIRQLRERITHSFSLPRFKPADVRTYLNFRLRAAGYRGPELFNNRVVDQISRISAGLSRRVNIIADKALLAAFADRTHTVSLKHVKAAVRDSEFANSGPAIASSRSALGYVFLGLLLGGAVSVAALLVFQTNSRDQIAATPEADNRVPAPRAQSETASNEAVQPIVIVSEPQSQAVSSPAAAIPPQTLTTTPVQTGDLLEQRLRATDAWLAETDENRFTIQLLGSNNADFLRQDLEDIRHDVELEQVFVYRTVVNRKPSFTVLLGTYGTRSEVLREIESLPETMKLNRPYFRTIKGVKAEIAQNGV